MKIFCIGRNYPDHAKELGNAIPTNPIFFMKPETALITNNKPFFLPDFSTEIHHEIEIVLKINKVGKNIAPNFAHRYYDELTIGLDFTARDLQQQCKEKGLPWEIAKSFDGSAPIGTFISKESITEFKNIDFQLTINQQVRQQGNSVDMLFYFDDLISYVSQFVTLKKGDLLFTGTPAGVGKVDKGDILEGFLNNEKLLHCKVL